MGRIASTINNDLLFLRPMQDLNHCHLIGMPVTRAIGSQQGTITCLADEYDETDLPDENDEPDDTEVGLCSPTDRYDVSLDRKSVMRCRLHQPTAENMPRHRCAIASHDRHSQHACPSPT
jgi:hypothetical protein